MAEKYVDCLICPITFTLFREPVVAKDGHTYERTAIIEWIQRNGTSPFTREPITIEGLCPNYAMKNLVEAFREDISKRNYKFKLGVDIDRHSNPFFHTTGKALYDATWIGNPNGPPIVLLKLYGARAEKEAAFYEQLTRHPHIVYTYGLVQPSTSMDSKTFVMLLQEKAPQGSLFNLLEHHGDKHPEDSLSEILLNEIFIQITDAMIFLSEKGIIHGDLACRNVLVFRIDDDEPKKSLVKLTDFGISRGNPIYSKIDAVNTVIDVIPIRSSAPEVLENNDSYSRNIYSEKSDMYAMGVLMWEAYSNGRLPWENVTNESMIRQKVINGERLTRPNQCKSDYHWNIIFKCMAQQRDDRPRFVELKKQLTEFVPSSIKSSTTVSKDDSCYKVELKNELFSDPSPSINIPTVSVIVTEKTESIEPNTRSSTIEEIEPKSSPIMGGKVKRVCSLFEQKIDEHQQSYSNNRPKGTLYRNMSFLKPKKSVIIPPQQELIKLTKWH
ncbi:hypothetical protein I4U23_030432 [Adineta vaga]|nr:hypothetical protein I4U23_030432 [Adineta vaga]